MAKEVILMADVDGLGIEGDIVKVKVLEINGDGKVRLSRRALLDPPPEGERRDDDRDRRGGRRRGGGRQPATGH